MTIVNDIMKQMPGLGQPQRKFLATLFVTILVLRGRVNFRNLSRYCDYAERTVVYLSPADKYHRLTRRLSQGQKGLDERALMASQRPSAPW
jgi:hypothetical protein